MSGLFPTYVVTGTDTDVGKTVFSAVLMTLLQGVYFKPIQAGTEGGTDTERVKAMSGLGSQHFLTEAYCLKTPASPHFAAELDHVEIDLEQLKPPQVDAPLVVEGAGGVLVPVTRKTLYADLFASWQKPVIVCARTALGGINHALLTLEALKSRGAPIHGIVFIGDEVPDTQRTIVEISGVRSLGRLPRLSGLGPQEITQAAHQHFSIDDFQI